MFSGIQEILVLVIIILGILFLPRILNRGGGKRPAESKPAIALSGKMRMAIASSVIWPALLAAFMLPWKKDPFLYPYNRYRANSYIKIEKRIFLPGQHKSRQ